MIKRRKMRLNSEWRGVVRNPVYELNLHFDLHFLQNKSTDFCKFLNFRLNFEALIGESHYFRCSHWSNTVESFNLKRECGTPGLEIRFLHYVIIYVESKKNRISSERYNSSLFKLIIKQGSRYIFTFLSD
jgi:hypothetical protein